MGTSWRSTSRNASSQALLIDRHPRSWIAGVLLAMACGKQGMEGARQLQVVLAWIPLIPASMQGGWQC
jgi:hypothetical protein